MATIIRCDGCDKKLPEGRAAYRVDIGLPNAVVPGWDKPRFFDLCPQCLDRMLENANPMQWPKAAPLSPEQP